MHTIKVNQQLPKGLEALYCNGEEKNTNIKDLIHRGAHNGRQFESCVIGVFGAPSSGKEVTMKKIFNQKFLTATSDVAVKNALVLRKVSEAVSQCPVIKLYHCLLDLPMETKGDADIIEFQKLFLQKFIRQKGLCDSIIKDDTIVETNGSQTVYEPNVPIFLLFVSADSKIEGPNTHFGNVLSSLKKTSFLENQIYHLIVVVTRSLQLITEGASEEVECDVGAEKILFVENYNQIHASIQRTVGNQLNISQVPTIFIENKPMRVLERKPGTKFYVLPNGEVSHLNLLQAIASAIQENWPNNKTVAEVTPNDSSVTRPKVQKLKPRPIRRAESAPEMYATFNKNAFLDPQSRISELNKKLLQKQRPNSHSEYQHQRKSQTAKSNAHNFENNMVKPNFARKISSKTRPDEDSNTNTLRKNVTQLEQRNQSLIQTQVPSTQIDLNGNQSTTEKRQSVKQKRMLKPKKATAANINRDLQPHESVRKVNTNNVHEDNCFPPGTQVFITQNTKFTEIAIEKLQKGHKLVTVLPKAGGKIAVNPKGDGMNATQFCTFIHAEPHKVTEYQTVLLANGRKLIVSDNHLIITIKSGRMQPTKAVDIRVGTSVLSKTAEVDDATFKLEITQCVHVSRTRRMGAFAPLAFSGTFFANGVWVTSYASVNSFTLAHLSLAPLRVWHFLDQRIHHTLDVEEDNKTKSSIKLRRSGDKSIHWYARRLMCIRAAWQLL